MYRSFKSQCPTGFIREDTFKDIYSQFFPFGGLLKVTPIKHEGFKAIVINTKKRKQRVEGCRSQQKLFTS